MSLPKSFDIPETLHKFIDKLKQGQDSAKLDFDKHKSLSGRATSAYEKAFLTESKLKDYYDKLVQTNKYTNELIRELDGTLGAICRIVDNTQLTADKTKKLVVEVGEVLIFAENLKEQLKDFRKCVEKSPKLVVCVDAVLKTLTPGGTIEELVTAFQSAVVALKKAILLHEIITGNCGFHARIGEVRSSFGKCCLPLELEETKAIDDPCPTPSDSTCKIPSCEDVTGDEICDCGDCENGDCEDCCCEYNKYKAEGSVASICVAFDIQAYANKLESAYTKAKILRKRAYEWMKCTKEATELSESRYISCKAAYDAALVAKKC
jgi:hypothetical protein